MTDPVTQAKLQQLLAIAARHAEDHKHGPNTHPRPDTWAADAVGDRGALLEMIVDMAQGQIGRPLKSALEALRPQLQTPRLPGLAAPGLPDLRTRKLGE